MHNTLLYGFIAGIASILGSAVFLLRKKWSSAPLYWLLAFGSGVFLGASFLHILPEAMESSTRFTGIGLILAFLSRFTLEQFTMFHSCPDFLEEECPVHTMGLVAFGAIFLHSMVDGLAVAASFRASLSLGLTTSFAVIIHKFSEGLTLTAILLTSDFGRAKAARLSCIAALATPVGAFLTFITTAEISKAILALLLGISAGSFIYIAASDILPRLHHGKNFATLFFLATGIGIMFFVSLAKI